MLRQRIQDDMKAALKAGDRRRFGVIRLITQVLAVLDKLVKQRRGAIEQYTKANRADLAAQEAYRVGRTWAPSAS